jgi:hypothetical protein
VFASPGLGVGVEVKADGEVGAGVEVVEIGFDDGVRVGVEVEVGVKVGDGGGVEAGVGVVGIGVGGGVGLDAEVDAGVHRPTPTTNTWMMELVEKRPALLRTGHTQPGLLIGLELCEMCGWVPALARAAVGERVCPDMG